MPKGDIIHMELASCTLKFEVDLQELGVEKIDNLLGGVSPTIGC